MAEQIRRIRPTPTDAYLDNPHRGCCTFQRFNGDPLFPGTTWSEEGPLEFPAATQRIAEGYLPTTVAYCRWFWQVLEPEMGKFDFSVIDKSLEVCRERGQTLAVRLMAFGSPRQPQVPDWCAGRVPMVERNYKSLSVRVPVHDSPEYFDYWGRLISAFASRYDGHPLLESIDLAYIGPWGEGDGDGECSPETVGRFSNLWKSVFPKTPRLAQLVENQHLQGIASGAGWRHDCFGDLNSPGSHEVLKHCSYNATFDDYPYLVQGIVKDAWKTAPVHFETCAVPATWNQPAAGPRGFSDARDIDFILEQGLKLHGTYFMPKSTRLPERWMDKLDAFCRKLGYRYVYRQAMLDVSAPRRGAFRFRSWIENVGVAPIYRRYDFALRFRQGDQEAIVTFDDVDIRTWLPGDVWLDKTAKLPESIKPGWAEVSAALVDPASREARISFAVKEVFADRWVTLGGINVS